MSKVNVLPIIHGHLGTLYDQRTQRYDPSDFLLLFVIPLLIGIGVVALRFGFRVDAVNGFLNAFAILMGLLLNLLVLVFTLASTTTVTRSKPALRRLLMREVFFNIGFCILLALAVVIQSVVALSYMRSNPFAVTGPVATFVLSAVGSCFVGTLLMVIKRMYVLMDSELSTADIRQED